MTGHRSPHSSEGRRALRALQAVWKCAFVGIPPPGLISKQGQTKRGTSAISLLTPPSNEATINEPSPSRYPSIRQNGSSSGSLLPLLQEQGKRKSTTKPPHLGVVVGKRSHLEKSANASTYRTTRSYKPTATPFSNSVHQVVAVGLNKGIGQDRTWGVCRLGKDPVFPDRRTT